MILAADARLAEIGGRFDYLVHITPTNTRAAWSAFRRARYERPPQFVYAGAARFDAAAPRRDLAAIDLTTVEDPAIRQLLAEKRAELDTQLALVSHLNRPAFLETGLRLFGAVDDELLDVACALLRRIPPRARDGGGPRIDAHQFADRARAEIDRYRADHPDFAARVALNDTPAGLLVSHGHLYINSDLTVAASRIQPLLQHEVGTHLLTFYNGRAQPLRLLSVGLAGYEELQEGLAVLAEYLGGGLSRSRLRVLAGRVLAARRVTEGASFIETYRELVHEERFPRQVAFMMTARVYRGGGITKDAIYLRGLLRLLDYLRRESLHESLFAGKIAFQHIPLIQELTQRNILQQPPVRPHYLAAPALGARLDRLHGGLSVFDLIERKQ
jgi:uncharacterized protein (TIGR02421 family)